MRALVRLIANTAVFMLVSHYVTGFYVSSWVVALVAALVFGIVNATLRPLLILVTLPATLLSLGLFTLVIDAAVMGLCALLVPGFTIAGFMPALIGWILVSIGGVVTNWLLKE